MTCTWPGDEIGDRLVGAAIGHVLDIEAELLLEQLEAQLLQGADAGRGIIVVARACALTAAISSSSELTGMHRRIDHEPDAAGRERAERREARRPDRSAGS